MLPVDRSFSVEKCAYEATSLVFAREPKATAAIQGRSLKATANVPGLPRPSPLWRGRPRHDESMTYAAALVQLAARCF